MTGRQMTAAVAALMTAIIVGCGVGFLGFNQPEATMTGLMAAGVVGILFLVGSGRSADDVSDKASTPRERES